MIRFQRIAVQNMGVLRSIDLDLAAIPGKLVAVTGPNGSGKSTLLGLLAAALYREAPTRGSLTELATTRDARLEVSFVNGQAWTAKHLVDGVSHKSEATAWDATGVQATTDAKVRSFDQWAARVLPAPEVLFAATFAAQGSGGFLAMSASERKAVLLRILGVERLEVLAAKARENATKATIQARELLARKAEVGNVDPGAMDACHRAMTDKQAAFDEHCFRQKKHEEASANWLLAREALAKERARLERLANVNAALIAAGNEEAETQKRIANNAGIVAQADAIRVAAKALDEFKAHEARFATALKTSNALKRTYSEATDRQHKAWALLQSIDVELNKARVDVIGFKREAMEATEDEKIATEKHAASVAKLEAIRSESERRFLGRHRALRDALTDVQAAPSLPDVRTIASGALEHDDGTGKLSDEFTESNRPLKNDVTRNEKALSDAKGKARAASSAFESLVKTIELLERQRPDAKAKEDQAIADMKNEEDRLVIAQGEVSALRDAPTLTQETIRLAANLGPLEQAQARIEELGRIIGATKARAAKLREERAELEALAPSSLPSPNLETESKAAKFAFESATHALATRAKALDDAIRYTEMHDARFVRHEAIGAALATVDADVADWTRLALDLGRDGIQAAEIDAAGPELTELVNDLLHTCCGPRWTVSFETQRSSADKKRTIEGLEVRVLDTERGRDATAETLSGGERVLVGEAVSLALTMLACRRGGAENPTIVRDETGAALDPAAGRAYVSMLRRAADLTGASQVLFVTHDGDLAGLADSRIAMADGTAVVS